MKFLVDQLPTKCKECTFCADAMIMTQLGVQKPVNICTFWMLLVPPKTPNEEPHFIDKEKTPMENQCLCTTQNGGSSIIMQ